MSKSVLTALLALTWTSIGLAENEAVLVVPKTVQDVLSKRCMDCHSGDSPEADVGFDRLTKLDVKVRLEVLNRAQDQLFFGMMPPEDADQPSDAERTLLADWIRAELRKHHASKLDEKLVYPSYGNYVDHDKLFSGQIQEKAYTPARRWLVNPYVFEERILDIFGLQGRERENYRRRGFYGVTNPFVLPEHSGVRDYDITTLDGGHLLVMLTNAKWISTKQIRAARVKKGELKAQEFKNSKDRWYPKTTPKAFETIILKKTKPTDQEILNAIQTQFQLVLQREATEEEQAKYLKLTRSTIDLGGNTEGLRQMLVSVLLESELLYRLELGEGKADKYGRKKLSPREASYAISYALGDRNPDATLRRAAREGRLITKEDYRREVVRLLKDQNYYRGQIDKSLNGKHLQSHVTSHPKIIRFFRDFFGYPGAVRVFKDTKRSDGYYRNPGRGTAATPGFLIDEADRIVDWHVLRDQNVFENLLTTEHFFVYHNKDARTGRKVINEWKLIYEKLKSTDWKTNPEKVLVDHLEFLQAQKSIQLRMGRHKKWQDLQRYLHFFEETFGKGGTPFTTVPWQHGYTFHHAPFYSLPPTPGIYRYNEIVSGKSVEAKEFWNYPVEQPFRIANRKGILTHPAWLIAHSQNTATDPVRRGRWIREKLLAGRVPDVPITVDAQIPEDRHKTLRERLESVTTKAECWKCHRQMNPLGLPFEAFDDFGRYRTVESLEHPDNLIARAKGKNGADTFKTKAFSTLGKLNGTGNPKLDGEVRDAFDLIDRLAQSERVRQSMIRHAFRFFLGRNEMLSDAQTLIDADRAYVESDGSFKAVIVSLLTSDSFIYRKQPGTGEKP